MRKLSVFLTSKSGAKIGGYGVLLYPEASTNKWLAKAVTNAAGRADLSFELPAGVKSLEVLVLSPDGKQVIAQENRKLANVSDHWPIDLASSDDKPPPAPPKTEPAKPEPAKPETPKPPSPAGDAVANVDKDEAQVSLMPAERAAARIAGARRAREELRQAAGKEIGDRRKVKRRGRELANDLIGKRPRGRLRPQDTFIPQSKRKDLPALLKKHRETALQTLGKGGPDRQGIALDDALVARLGLRPGGKTNWSMLEAEIGAGKSAARRSPIQTAIDDCRATHDRDSHVDDPLADASILAATSLLIDARDAALSNKPAAERISDVLDAALGTGTPRPAAADIARTLDVPVPLGPADVDAYYDYHNLRIAWADAWTAVGDKTMAGKLASLYETIVEVVDYDAADSPWDFSEIDELHDMLDTLEDAVEAASAVYAPVVDKPTPQLAAWMPELADVWHYLSDTERAYAELQYDLHQYVLSRTTEQVLENVATGGLSNFLNRKLWKIPPYDVYEQGWVPDMKIGEAVARLHTAPNFFRNRVRGQVDFEEARAEKAAADAEAAANDKPYATHAAARLGRAERLIGELKHALSEPYQFDVFSEGSYNFGVLTTYRQRWRPLNYQAGDLAGTLPLAPNEKRSYSVTHKASRMTKREQSSVFANERSRDAVSKSRAESEITDTVKRKLTGTVSTEATVKLGEFLSFTGGTTLNTEASNDSGRVKKTLKEHTDTAAQKYRDENKTSVSFEEAYETSTTESREISNPNNEITVTYLFYELQRRYEVSERFHDLEPVILVAYDMPRPDEVTEAWLLKYDWIIARTLLDRSFQPALSYLSQTFAGDEVSVEILKQQWKTQLAVVTVLKQQVGAHERLRDVARNAIEKSVTAAAGIAAAGDVFGNGLGSHLGKKLFNAAEDIAETQAENARAALAWADQDLNRIEQIVSGGATSLERATAAYVAAIEQRLNRRIQIDRLILHVKENILHYMQAIWAAEHADQRYLRLYDMEIQWPGDVEVAISEVPGKAVRPGGLGKLLNRSDRPRWRGKLNPPSFAETKLLHQIADLDRLLGFRGNLAIFPLARSNALTTYLAQDFLDSALALRDPDDSDTIPTASEAVKIAKCALEKAGDSERERIAEWLMEALRLAHSVCREVIVPTGELFIEALPGAHPLLEDFKLQHRAFDAAKAATEVRAAQMELIRRAMRLERGDTDDPDIDKVVRIEGTAAHTFDTSGE